MNKTHTALQRLCQPRHSCRPCVVARLVHPIFALSAQVGIPTVACLDYLSGLISLRLPASGCARTVGHHHTASSSQQTDTYSHKRPQRCAKTANSSMCLRRAEPSRNKHTSSRLVQFGADQAALFDNFTRSRLLLWVPAGPSGQPSPISCSVSLLFQILSW